MNIIVNKHTIEVTKDIINESEINVSSCEFTFDEAYNDLTKMAFFTSNGTTYKEVIEDNKCSIPYEVCETSGIVTLGVVGYSVEDEEYTIRYSPSPVKFYVTSGSWVSNAENSEPITPSELEQYQALLSQSYDEFKEKVELKISEIDTKETEIQSNEETRKTNEETRESNEATRISQESAREEYISTIKEEVEAGDFNGATFTPKVDNEGNISWSNDKGKENPTTMNIKGPKGDTGDVGPAGAIKVTIVEALPTTGEEGTIYLVPKTSTESQNIYDEYMWINNQFELIGSRMLDIDMSQYYTKAETNTQISSAKSEIEGEIPTKVSELTNDKNYVTTTSYASSSTGGVVKSDSTYGVLVNANGQIYGNYLSYSDYANKDNHYLVAKGTLDNVLNEKIGDIESALNEILGDDE